MNLTSLNIKPTLLIKVVADNLSMITEVHPKDNGHPYGNSMLRYVSVWWDVLGKNGETWPIVGHTNAAL